MLYNSYSSYLKEKYNEKVYKIPVNLPVTCPNRLDGGNGCTYCSDVAVGFEMLSNEISITSQLVQNIEYIGTKYKAKKFVAYFQNFTNTFMPLDIFEKCMMSVVRDDVVEIAISTRPDCISEPYLEILKTIKQKYKINICIEMGLQSVNYKTLIKINRGHTLAEYIDAVIMIKKYGFDISTHMILNLPYDDLTDVIEGAKILSALKIDFVKMHSLYIAKNTDMEKDYISGKLDVKTLQDYVEKAGEFLAYLDKNIVVQRLVGRAPKEDTVFCNYGVSWWKIKDYIEEYMIKNNLTQGCKCNYLNGKSVKRFLV